jgi:hypothetical protein
MKTWNGEPAKYAHYKLDGHFMRVCRNEFGAIRCYTKHPKDITDKVAARVLSARTVSSLPVGVEVYGELWTPDAPASGVKTAINNPDSRLLFHAFGFKSEGKPKYDGAGLRFVNGVLTSWGFRTIPWSPFSGLYTYAVLLESGYQHTLPEFEGRQIEGYVFKDGNQLNCRKWKPTKTIDLVVSGFTDGKGKYAGLIGAIVCKTSEGYEVCKAGGMADEQRANFSIDEDDYIGKVAEIAYQGVGAKGRLRHPRFIRMRDDKGPDGCGAAQDADLERIWNDDEKNS